MLMNFANWLSNHWALANCNFHTTIKLARFGGSLPMQKGYITL
jgi:hypothetical protein